ncbi:glycosyltransferase family 4 protein [Hymenobacter sp. HD11105]
MKVLYDHQIYIDQKFGGISRYFNELMKIENDLYDIDRIDPELFRVKEEVIKKDILSKGKRFIKRKLGSSHSNEDKKFPMLARKKMVSNAYDVFHPTYYDPYFIDIINKPFVVTVYDMIHEIYKEYFSLQDSVSKNKQILCKNSKAIIAISDKTKNDLIELFDIPSEKIHVTHLASDFDKYIPIKPEIGTDLKRYILFVGTRWAYKNFYFFVLAISSLLKSDPNVHVLCTGHAFSADEISFFQQHGIEDQMVHVYLNNDNELAWAYQNAVMFVFPSLYEGFGLPILEAFASNCPVVTSYGGSLPEVAGDAAIYFNPKSAHEIKEAVSSVLYSNIIRNDLIAKGRKRYTDFSWDKCRSETQKVYYNL